MLNNLYVPDSQSKMPSSEHSKHGTQHLLLKHLTDFPWLAVSQILRGAFCTACVLFSKEGVGKTGGQSTGKLVKTPLTQFKNLLGKNGDLTKHASCHFHIEAMKDMVSFKKRMTSGPLSTDIDKQLITARLEEAKHNRSILVPIIDTILTCGQQNIALRGNREEGAVDSKRIEPKSNDGNFRSLLRYRIRGGDKELKRHCEMHSKKTTYMSGRIQNEILKNISSLILTKISQQVFKSLAFTIIADETLDSGKIEQMAICLRYVTKDPIKGMVIHEDPIRIIDLIDTIRSNENLKPSDEVRLTGKNMGTVLVTALTDLGLDMQKCVGQCYDGAKSMLQMLIMCTVFCIILILGHHLLLKICTCNMHMPQFNHLLYFLTILQKGQNFWCLSSMKSKMKEYLSLIW